MCRPLPSSCYLVVASLILASYLSCSAEVISVSGPLSVVRGNYAKISRSIYTINATSSNGTTAQCLVTYINDVGHQCGEVKPKRLRCDENEFAYVHHGCLNQYEMLNFRVISQQNDINVSYVADFSISVHVIAAETVLELSTKPVVADSASSTHELTIHCPTNSINRCHYSLLSPVNHNTSLAQTTTRNILEGSALDRSVPCGQSPKQPFLYKPINPNKTVDAFTIHMSCIDGNDVEYNVLPFDSTLQRQPQHKIPKSYLRIKELAATPVSHELFHLDDLLEKHRYLKITFPVKHIGGFYPVYSSKRGYLDATVFTYFNLLRGEVVFIPNESSSASFVVITLQYHYYVSDLLGQPVANGIMEVMSSPRLGLKPSLRKNIGFSLYSGDAVEIGHDQLNFYPPYECWNYFINITTYPKWGTLYSNEKQLFEGDSLLVVQGNLSLTYDHDKENDYTSHDTISTNIKCFQHETFNVTIPVRIIEPYEEDSFSDYYCSQDIYGYPGFATHIGPTIRECHPIGSDNSLTVSIVNNSNYFLFRNDCRMDSLHSYPYINKSEKVWSECFYGISLNNSDFGEEQWTRLWYFFPSTSQSISSKLLIVANSGITINIQYNVINLLTSPQIDFVHVTAAGMANYTHTYSSMPYLRHNRRLSMHTLDATHITSQYLYVQSLGYLQTEIVYYVASPPRNGYVCMVQHTLCDASINNFTQEDILADRVYYKPMQRFSVLRNDSFEFEVYYLDDIKLKGRNTFVIKFEQNVNDKQFWVPNGQSRSLLRKHLRNLIASSVPVSNIEFVLIKQPKHGYLHIPKTHNTFTWQDIKDRSIKYHHRKNDNKNVVCSDNIGLSVRLNQEELFAINIPVAIRYRQNNALNITSKEHLLDGGDSFVLSVKDLTISTGFCQEFVRVIVKQPPKYGLLIVNDPFNHTKRQLSTNATFRATDISDGHISYLLYPDLTLLENTEDQFLFVIEDPRGVVHEPTLKREVSNDGSTFRLRIVIVPVEGSGDFLNFTFSTTQTKQVVELDNNLYGAVLGPSDLYTIDSNFHPSEVHFLIHQPNEYGYLTKDNYPIEEFTLADIYSYNVTYISTLPHTDTTIMGDEFLYHIFIDLYDTKRKIVTDGSFHFDWCYFVVDLQQEEETFIAVPEIGLSTSFILRQIGSKSEFLKTSVDVTIESDDNDTIGVNCSDIEDKESVVNEADYCIVNDTIEFIGKTTKQTIYVKLIDDTIPEKTEMLRIKLSNAQGCLIPKWLDRSIYILDRDDYSLDVQFSQIYQTSYDKQCGLSKIVYENVGTFNLTLTRKGNLDIRLGVVCYTVGSKQQGISSSDDYIHRPNSNDSLIYFLPGENETHCPITIIDDQLNEQGEYFEVKLVIQEGEFAYRKVLKSSLCVYINHDTNDEPIVSFSSPIMKIQESMRHPVTMSFTILRTGYDLQQRTSLACFILPNGNATQDIDYVININNLGEIIIPPRATEINVSIEILNDTLVEGTEGFRIQMTDPYYNGKMTNPSTMEVAILDAKKDIFIGFSSEVFLFQETQQFVQIPFYRHGNLNYSTIVNCNTIPLTIDFEDVVTVPETVTLLPGSTNGVCSFFIIDDNVREREELMNVTIVTSDPSVHIIRGTTVIKIADYEDAPHATFNKSHHTIKEPLSSSIIDHTVVTLKVNINGDTLVNSTLCYRTINGTAIVDRDYVYSQGQLNVLPTDDNINITVRILTNRLINKNTWFYVALYMCNHDDDIIIEPYNVTRVTIKNRAVTGAFFVSLPIVLNLVQNGGSNNSNENTLSYDNPVICIAPCDINHPNYSHTECSSQDIQPDLTHYKWEISYNTTNSFVPLQFNTLLTKTDSRILQPVYFKEGVWLRCSATAVDSNGIKGFTRTGIPVQLTRNTSQCIGRNVSQDINFSLTSYREFTGQDEDLLHLTMTLPSIPNYFPIITTTPITDHVHSLLMNSPTQSKYPCSTVSHYHEFISDKLIPKRNYHYQLSSLFFEHYDYNNCSWSFSFWLSLDRLKTQCSAQISSNQLSVNITLYIQYAQIINNTINSFQLTNKTVSYIANPRGVAQTSPFKYHPMELSAHFSSYLNLIAISRQYNSQQILFIMQSHSNGVFIEGSYSIANSEIDHAYPIMGGSIFDGNDTNNQTWIFSITDDGVLNSFDLMIVLTLCPEYDSNKPCSETMSLSYSIPVTLERGLYRTGMRLKGHTEALDATDIGSVKTVISLDPTLVLMASSSDTRLAITSVAVCGYNDDKDIATDDCSNGDYTQQIYNTETSQDWDITISAVNSSFITFYTDISAIKTEEPSITNWYYHVTCSLKHIDYDITKHINIPINSRESADINTSTDTLNLPYLGNNGMPVYATVLISLMLLMLTVVCSVTGVIVWYGMRKRYTLRKLELEAAIQQSATATERKEKNHKSTGVSYKKKHVGRHIPQNKSSFHLLMRQGTEKHIKNTKLPQLLDSRLSDSPSLLSDDSLSTDTLPTTPSPLSTVLTSETNNPLNNNDSLLNNTPVATVKPLSIRLKNVSFQPTQTISLSQFGKSLLTASDRKSFLPISIGKQDNTPKPVSNPGWYERHLARKQAMDAYVQLYLTNNNNSTNAGNNAGTIDGSDINNKDAIDDNTTKV